MNEISSNLNELVIFYGNNKVKMWDTCLKRCIGEILLNMGDKHILEAEKWIKKAMETDGMNRMMWHLGRDYVLYSELLTRKGDLSKAKGNLTRAIKNFEESGADGWVQRTEEKLARL